MSTPKNIGLATSLRGVKHFAWNRSAAVSSRPKLLLLMPQMADDVLHHHDRTVDDEAKVDRPQAHQVAGDACFDHAGDGEEHRQRNGERDNQCCSQVAQQRKQDHHDEQAPSKRLAFTVWRVRFTRSERL